MDFIKYNPKLKERARELRKNSTPSEIELWKALRAGQLRGYTFNRQKPLDEFIVDFYQKKLKLVIEIDGDSHNGKQEYDQKRQRKLESLGCTVIRFYDHDVMQHLDGVLFKIQETVEQLEEKDIPLPKGVRGISEAPEISGNLKIGRRNIPLDSQTRESFPSSKGDFKGDGLSVYSYAISLEIHL